MEREGRLKYNVGIIENPHCFPPHSNNVIVIIKDIKNFERLTYEKLLETMGKSH